MSDEGRSQPCEATCRVDVGTRLRCSLDAHGGMAHHDREEGYKWFDPWRALPDDAREAT